MTRANYSFFIRLLLFCLIICFCLPGCMQSTSETDGNSQTSLNTTGNSSSTPEEFVASEPVAEIDPTFSGDIVSIALYINPNLSSMTLATIEDILKEQMETANQYLDSTQRDYRLSFEILQVDYASFDRYQDYNIILNMPYFLPESFVEEHFLELTEELRSGSLTTLYQSESEVYWKTVEENGKIYNPITNTSEVAEALWLDMESLQALGITKQDIIALKGQELSAWLPLFETIYSLNGNQPFINNPMSTAFMATTYRTPTLSGIAWEAHFQMIAPMVGISYDEPEKGAQFVLESDYANQILALWKSLKDAGYIFNSDDARSKDGTFSNAPLIWYQSTNSLDIVQRDMRLPGMADERESAPILICPLEEQLHSVCRSAWDTSRYSFLIPQNQTNLALTFQFINEMAEDPSFAAGIMLTDDSFLPDYVLSPIARRFCHETYFIDPDQRRVSAENTVLPQDTGFIYTPADSANLQKGIAFEYSGGVSHFDSTVFLMETSEDWLHFDERLEALKAMYHEEGIDEMVSEANEQLTQFRSHS